MSSVHGSGVSSWEASAEKARALAARQKLKDNAKVFDKKTGSFREAKIELIDGQVTREELLKAPSSFRRFMEATRRAREQQDRVTKETESREARRMRAKMTTATARRGTTNATSPKTTNPTSHTTTATTASPTRMTKKTHTWLHPDKGDHGAGVADDVAFEEAAHKKKVRKKKEPEPAAGERVEEEDGDARTGKRKYKSLRERKSEARKAAKAAKEEEDQFMGTVVETRDGRQSG